MPARPRRGGFFIKVPMPDYDLLIMSRDNTQKLPPGQEAGRWRAGEVVDIFLTGRLDPKTQPACFSVVTVTGYPGNLDAFRAEMTPENALSNEELTAMTTRRIYIVPIPATGGGGAGTMTWGELQAALKSA